MTAHHRFLPVFLSLWLVLLCAQQTPTPVTAAASTKEARIEDFAFISGHNRGEMDGGIIDEHWSEPAGNSLIGMFRYIKGGKVQRYEFLSIENSPNGPVLRLKHFNPGLIGLEDKTEFSSYALVSLKPGEAVFERSDKTAGLIFRSTSKETLEVTHERSGQKPQVFQYAHSNE
jgi:hypothetical protein